MQLSEINPQSTQHVLDAPAPTNDATTQPSTVAQDTLAVAQQASSNEIKSTCYIKVAKGVTRTLSIIGAAALGLFIGLTIMGTLMTPMGWGIAGATLVIGLVGSLCCGGKKELAMNLQLSVLSFSGGLGIGLAVGASLFVYPIGIPISEAGPSIQAAYWGGFATYVVNLFSAAYTIEQSPLD